MRCIDLRARGVETDQKDQRQGMGLQGPQTLAQLLRLCL
jgi:hypothetical protein